MSVIARGTSKAVKIIYPATCKEATEELGKDELVRRLKVKYFIFIDCLFVKFGFIVILKSSYRSQCKLSGIKHRHITSQAFEVHSIL